MPVTVLCFQLKKRMKNKKEEEKEIEKKKCLLEKRGGAGREWEKCDIPSPCVRLAGVWHVRLSGDFLPLPPYQLFFLLPITPSTSPPSSVVLLYVSFLHYPCSCSTLSFLLSFFSSFPHTDTSSTSLSDTDTRTVHSPCVYRKCVLMYSPVCAIYPSLRSRLA